MEDLDFPACGVDAGNVLGVEPLARDVRHVQVVTVRFSVPDSDDAHRHLVVPTGPRR
jgi:hypothetical protein